MNVLVIGSGGREHALCWALSASPLCRSVYCAPGNGGIMDVAACIELDTDNHADVIRFCRENDIGLVVIGPEGPLVAGLVDDLEQAGLKAFGPTRAAARLEASKGFTKDLCARHGIPTAAYARFTDPSAARAYIRENGAPIVVKADGLASGKGVIVATTVEEAEAAVDANFSGRFGNAGNAIVIEEFLQGEEASYFALVDGNRALPLATAQDHKPVGDGDTGPNTGGMGAYSPAPIITEELSARVMAEIIEPTVKAMADAGTPYRGVLYAGLMITADGPKLIEYNVRFGDPECQVLTVRLKSDLLPALLAVCDGTLDQCDLAWRDEAALTVVMATKGYPGEYEKGSTIRGIDAAAGVEGVTVFHAGTRREGNRYVAAGGRVLNITATGATVAEARRRAYEAVALIDWSEGFCRRDIGWRALTMAQGDGRPVARKL